MRSSYLDYAMSVIVGRALPDARDGLKPVHRRVLYAMNELGLNPNRPYSKCAKIVGEVMGNYHPHGDSAIYDTLVRLAQDFSMRNVLVDGQGNFGSVDDDPAAAMRYCLAGETRVATDRGSVRIADLAAGMAPDSERDVALTVRDRKALPVSASKLFHSGDHPTLRLSTREGFAITATENHPLLCLVDIAGVPMLMWKRLDEIRAGDRVVLNRSTPRLEADLTLHERTLALLLGAFVSEGWASQTRAGFNNVDQEFFEVVAAAYERHVGGPRYIYDRVIKSGSRLYELDIQNLAAFRESELAFLIGDRAAGKFVPERVWQGSLRFKQAFLRALFTGDGSSSLLPRKTIQVSYSTYSRRLARDVQQLLLEFGVVSRLCGPTTRGETKVVITNRRDARLFSQRIGFLGDKQAKLERDLAAIPLTSRALSSDHVPFVSEYVRGETPEPWLRRHNFDRIERWERDGTAVLDRIASDEVKATIEPLMVGDHYYAEVASVQPAGVQPVYSVRVDSDDHAFLADGFINHNTEARLAPLAREMLRDLDADTVDFVPNYSNETSEPTVLPSRFPNLLVNGSSGIAVGMATNIPPHNLRETIAATIAYIDNPNITVEALMKHLPGPDFPTGGIILGSGGIRDAYETGRGKVRVRCKAGIEDIGQGKEAIIVTELPFMVKKGGDTGVISKMVDLVNEKKIPEISDLRDESDGRTGMRLVIELKRGSNPDVVLNKLYKHTALQSTFGVNTVALVDNVPRTLPLREMLRDYIQHQREIIVRRSKHELRTLEAQVHRLEGLLIALDHLDAVIELIRASPDRDAAREGLMSNFGLTQIQAQAILELRLQQLTALEADSIRREHADKVERIRELRELLGDEHKVLALIKEELAEISERYGDERRTVIAPSEEDFNIEDLIAERQMVITITQSSYIKALPLDTYRSQARGGRGVAGHGDEGRGLHRAPLRVLDPRLPALLHQPRQGLPQEGARAAGARQPPGQGPLPGQHAARCARASASRRCSRRATSREGKFLLFATRQGIVKKTEFPPTTRRSRRTASSPSRSATTTS